jgi:hypothetical protein
VDHVPTLMIQDLSPSTLIQLEIRARLRWAFCCDHHLGFTIAVIRVGANLGGGPDDLHGDT